MRRPRVRDLREAAEAARAFGAGPVPRTAYEAWGRSREGGSCPVFELDGFLRERYDVEDLCLMFPCRRCVAGDDEFGPPDEPGPGGRDDWEIPF